MLRLSTTIATVSVSIQQIQIAQAAITQQGHAHLKASTAINLKGGINATHSNAVSHHQIPSHWNPNPLPKVTDPPTTTTISTTTTTTTTLATTTMTTTPCPQAQGQTIHHAKWAGFGYLPGSPLYGSPCDPPPPRESPGLLAAILVFLVGLCCLAGVAAWNQAGHKQESPQYMGQPPYQGPVSAMAQPYSQMAPGATLPPSQFVTPQYQAGSMPPPSNMDQISGTLPMPGAPPVRTGPPMHGGPSMQGGLTPMQGGLPPMQGGPPQMQAGPPMQGQSLPMPGGVPMQVESLPVPGGSPMQSQNIPGQPPQRQVQTLPPQMSPPLTQAPPYAASQNASQMGYLDGRGQYPQMPQSYRG